jgi:hypothetical protein
MRHFLQDDGEMYNMVSPFRWFTESIFHAARDCYWTIQEHLTALVSGHPSRTGSVVKSDPIIDHLDPVHVVKTFGYSQFNMMIARASVGGLNGSGTTVGPYSRFRWRGSSGSGVAEYMCVKLSRRKTTRLPKLPGSEIGICGGY